MGHLNGRDIFFLNKHKKRTNRNKTLIASQKVINLKQRDFYKDKIDHLTFSGFGPTCHLPTGVLGGGLRVRQIGWKLQIGLWTPEQECRLFLGDLGTPHWDREDHM